MGNKGLSEETVEKHESYGMIGMNRVSGDTHLFGSMMKHHSFLRIEIRRAEKRRHLAHEWYYAESLPLIEVDISHTALAEMITAPGVGHGVPCTIRQVGGKGMEKCPPPESMESKFADDLKKTTQETVAELQNLSRQLEEVLLPGNKTLNKKELSVLLSGIRSAVMSVTDSIPFIEKSFGEEMEKEKGKAIAELEGVRDHIIHQVGLAALGATAIGAKLPEFKIPMLPTKTGDAE